MKLVALTAAATLVLAGTAMARETHHHHHPVSEANASVATDGAIPADSMSAHDAHMRNLRESGYNPHNDFDANGVVKQN
jgi:hypothetical protein